MINQCAVRTAFLEWFQPWRACCRDASFAGWVRTGVSTREGALIDFDYVESFKSDGAIDGEDWGLASNDIEVALSSSQTVLKRCVDIVGAVIGLIISAPVIAVLAVLVKLDSPGPVLFKQARLGLLGAGFLMYKLRTMRDGADAEKAALSHLNVSDDSRLFKIPEDPRVTRLGRMIRRWSLDELPQLYNVLVGDMSLVGPRPFFEEDLSKYQPHHFSRLVVSPGLTGLWQVSGRSEIVDFDEVVRLDREYIDNWSFRLDLWILGRTLPVVINRRGAY
jgi:lipopolysaccharide/colanic/teichoic acid biosynthesis glycosyltransferase